MLYLQKTLQFVKETYRKWTWFTKIYSAKCNVLRVLNGNSYEKLLPQKNSSTKGITNIYFGKTSSAFRITLLRAWNLFVYFFHVAIIFCGNFDRKMRLVLNLWGYLYIFVSTFASFLPTVVLWRTMGLLSNFKYEYTMVTVSL